MDKVYLLINEQGGSAAAKAFVSQRLSWGDIKKSYTGPNENNGPNNSHVVK